MTVPGDLQATFAATLVDEWVRAGVAHAVVAPGSRSTPLALALVGDGRVRVHIVLDERSAGFFALGVGVATGTPAVVLTTSGTAAVELHPAVVEASYAGVPLVAVTADRPWELRDVGAPQTIDQTALFGRAVRWFADPGVADAASIGAWRSLASRAIAEAVVGCGPVHLNLPFRDPLVGTPGPLPPGRPGGAPWHTTAPAASGTENLPQRGWFQVPKAGGGRGIVVAGRGAGRFGDVIGWAKERGWPVLADPLSGCRVPDENVIARFDPLLRCDPFTATATPDVVVRVGSPPASKVLARWLASLPADTIHVQVVAPGTWPDPERTASYVVEALPDVAARTEPGWCDRWRGADDAAEAALAAALADRLTEPAVARALVDGLPDGSRLVVSSSMPIRDVEWYARPRTGIVVHANRGANGIDGIVSTALGVAAGSAAPTAALLGDLALLHDAGGLLWAADRGVDCTLVVVDNDGGGIFSFLPQADLPDAFERLFGTPHRVDLRHLAALHHVELVEAATVDDVAAAAAATGTGSGVRLVLARVPDRQANVEIHRDLDAAVAAAVAATC